MNPVMLLKTKEGADSGEPADTDLALREGDCITSIEKEVEINESQKTDVEWQWNEKWGKSLAEMPEKLKISRFLAMGSMGGKATIGGCAFVSTLAFRFRGPGWTTRRLPSVMGLRNGNPVPGNIIDANWQRHIIFNAKPKVA